MNSKNFFFNNADFSKNNKKQNEIKFKSRCDSKNNINLNNNLNDSKCQISRNKNIVSKEEKNKIIHNKIEDFYNFDIYKNSIAQCNFAFLNDEEIYNYKTISVTNSFQKKFKEIFKFDKNKSLFDRNNVAPIELTSELNLSFEAKNNKCLILGKPFNNDISHLNNIIRIFDKGHKKIEKINQKNFNNKYNHYYVYKNRINNYNYLKFKTKSKFSKKEHNKSLIKNYSTIMKSHIKITSEPIQEQNNRRSKLKEKREYMDKIIKPDEKNSLQIKNNNQISKINDVNSIYIKSFDNTITEQRNKIKDIKLVYKESEQNRFIKNNNNVPIALSKNIIKEKINENSNLIDVNNNNRNSANSNGSFFYKYRVINNQNRKAKSILEENEKNNNNQSMRNSVQQKDNIKKNKIIKIENIQNNRVIYKKIQRSEINKNQNKINTNPNQINQEKVINKNKAISTQVNEHNSINNENKDHTPININKRKKNLYLSKNISECPKYNLDKNKSEENNLQIYFGRSFIQSHQSTSQSLISEGKNNKNYNNDLTKTVNNLSKLEDSKNEVRNSITKLRDKNLINNKSFLLKSDKVNKSKIIFENPKYKLINSQNNNINLKKNISNEVQKKQNLKSDRFSRRNIITERIEGDKIGNDKINQGQEIANLNAISINKKAENPFRDKNEFHNYKRINNKYGNHRFHEIQSSSCEKKIKIIQENKDNINISYKVDNKYYNHPITSSSMRYINMRRKTNNNKEKEPDKKNEK